jgi:hypothetical protein
MKSEESHFEFTYRTDYHNSLIVVLLSSSTQYTGRDQLHFLSLLVTPPDAAASVLTLLSGLE